MTERVATYPRQAPIDAYGNGGFRFASMSHRGSLLLTPAGIFAWSPDAAEGVTPDDFAPLFEVAPDIEFVLFGTGAAQIFPGPTLADAFAERNIGLEAMSTGAACRAYNVVLGEQRAFAAAVIAVD